LKLLLEKLGISITHLICLDEIFIQNNDEYRRIESIFNSSPFSDIVSDISKELYAGGKQSRGSQILNRQMILGDIIEYIFTGRAYYFAAISEENFKHFLKLILYSVNQLLILDTITVNPDIRKEYIEKLESEIDHQILYEKAGDQQLADELKNSNTIIYDSDWKRFDALVDSLLPKTLGCPKELVVFAELIRSGKGVIIPLLLLQRIFLYQETIAPPDFLVLKSNKEIFGIEVGYRKEEQSREFNLKTSIPTFAVDLKNNLHNRCPKCGEIILYCDFIIESYSNNDLPQVLDEDGKYYCYNCEAFDDGRCKFSNYHGKVRGTDFAGRPIEKPMHYHALCVRNESYTYYSDVISIIDEHKNEFFAQIPAIDGLENL